MKIRADVARRLWRRRHPLNGGVIDVVTVTILHELAHWLCYYKKTWNYEIEQGEQFEELFYGGKMPRGCSC